MFLYESLLNFLGCFLLLFLARKLGKRLLDGDIISLYVIYYGLVRFALEGLKIDVWTIAGFPTARWISIIAIIAVVAVMIDRRLRRRRTA